MKVEYLLQLWNSFNKKIWADKQFAIFLYIFIILGTILLRQSPGLYYAFLEHKLYLTLIVIIILALSSHNMILGILLTVSILALYYPSHPHSIEGFKSNDDEDEEKEFALKTVDPTDSNIDVDEDDIELEDDVELEEDSEEKPKEKTKTKTKTKENFKGGNKKKITRGLEDINPEFFIKKKNDDGEKGNESDDASEEKPSKPAEGVEKESFLGELREVFYDLDSGRNKMNVKNAVKKITDIVYHKRRNEVEKILHDDDTDSDTSSDEDYF
jgi:Ca2+/Na+ antiporter